MSSSAPTDPANNQALAPNGSEGLASYSEECRRTEAALRESEERYRDLFENANDIIYTLDLDRRLTSINKRAEQALGYTRGEVLGRHVAELIPTEYHPRMQDALRRKMEGEQAPTTYELEVLCKDGQRLSLEVSSRLIVRDGRPVGVQGIARDITERKRAEREREQLTRQAQAERAFLEAVLQQMPGGVVIAEASSGKIVLRNRQEPSLAELGLLRPPDAGPCDPHTGPHYGSPQEWPLLRSLRAGEAVKGEEMDFQRGDGSRGTISTSSTPVRDEHGNIVAAVATWYDITERKRTEEAQRFLAQAGEVLSVSLDHEVTLREVARLAVPTLGDWCTIDMLQENGALRRVAVVHPDPARVVLSQELLSRYPLYVDGPEGLVITTGEAIFIPEITEEHLAAFARDESHLEVLRTLRLSSCMVLPLSARGHVLGAVSLVCAESGRRYGPADRALAEELCRRTALAVDNARLYQELQAADRRKDAFLAMLAHELRNPLGPVRNALAILNLAGGSGQAAEQSRAIIDRQVRHLTRLVDDLLDVSRISRGKIQLRCERLDLTALIRAAAEDRRSSLEEGGLTLRVDLPAESLWVDADPTRIAQVLDNLLGNANKFTDPGGRVRVGVEREGGRAAVTVEDSGIGIAPPLLAQLWGPFAQADMSLERSRGGLGLGLALVKGLVELHGGRVRAASAGPGQGAAFGFDLPLRAAPAAGAAPPPAVPAPAGPLHVLLVEDNVDAAETMRMLLEMYGARVSVAHTGPAGVEAARRGLPDLILCDIGLPGLSGYEVARALRADPATASTCLVAVSGYGQPEDQEKSRRSGFDLHLIKPVEPGELQRLLAIKRH
jgi:PAS domain S-box-containing protein